MKDKKEELHYIDCPHCGKQVFVEGNTTVIDLPSDSERCASRSFMYNLRCTKKKGHKEKGYVGDHEHWPFVWMTDRNVAVKQT